MKYKVINLIDNTWQVIRISEILVEDEVMYQGSLSDCEAWIRLREGGYL